MRKNPLIDELQQNKHLRTETEVAAFAGALAALAQAPQEEDLPALHRVFTDDCQHQEVMFGLVHFLESFDMKKQLTAFLEAVPTLSVQAPVWTKILYCRILNNDASRECFKKCYQAAPAEVQACVKTVLLQIQADDADFSWRVRQLVA